MLQSILECVVLDQQEEMQDFLGDSSICHRKEERWIDLLSR